MNAIDKSVILPTPLEEIFKEAWKYSFEHHVIWPLASSPQQFTTPNGKKAAKKRLIIMLMISIPKKDPDLSPLSYMVVTKETEYLINDNFREDYINDEKFATDQAVKVGLLWLERKCRRALLDGYYEKKSKGSELMIRVELANDLTAIRGEDMNNYIDQFKPSSELKPVIPDILIKPEL